jgi:ubiquinone/menaquinone biosynthesis C-methylase UbiE
MNEDLKWSMFEYYRERVPEYDEVYQGKGPASISESDAYISEMVILSDIVKRTLSGDLVDIACGTAFWLPSYTHDIRHVTLLDQSREMLNAARARAESAGLLDRSTLVCGDILDLELDHGPFDCALIGFLISHLTSEQEDRFFHSRCCMDR